MSIRPAASSRSPWFGLTEPRPANGAAFVRLRVGADDPRSHSRVRPPMLARNVIHVPNLMDVVPVYLSKTAILISLVVAKDRWFPMAPVKELA